MLGFGPTDWAGVNNDGREAAGAIEPYNLITSEFFHKNWAHPRAPRLLSCSVCRLIWDQFTDSRSRKAIEVAEEYADGIVTLKALTAAHKTERTAYEEARKPDRWHCAIAAETACPKNVMSALESVVMTVSGTDQTAFDPLVMPMIHDVFHRRLFNPIILNPTWRTSTVLALATGIYEEKAFDRMPILADALGDAGCDNEDILNHCRGPGPHCRGCFAIDLILGKQ
jgi:hypothetical protein